MGKGLEHVVPEAELTQRPSFSPIPSTQITSLPLYSLTWNLTRTGMQALHSNLEAQIERFTVSAAPRFPSTATMDSSSGLSTSAGTTAARQRQVRVQLRVTGTPRLPGPLMQKDKACWQTSNLFTFSPVSGLIIEHKVSRSYAWIAGSARLP